MILDADFATLRYAMAVFAVTVLPVAIVYWLVIHGGRALWRHSGERVVWLVASAATTGIGVLAFHCSGFLVGSDLGTNWIVCTAGLLIYLATWAMTSPIRKHLSFRTFIGLPELRHETNSLLTDGPYEAVRHPRYLQVIIAIVGWCLVCNHLGLYVVGFCSILAFVLIAQLEEQELLERFGEAYQTYRDDVPALVPKRGQILKLFAKQ